jgi:hypothetical protein
MEGTNLCSQGFANALLQYPERVEDGHPLTQQDLVCLKRLDLHLIGSDLLLVIRLGLIQNLH